ERALMVVEVLAEAEETMLCGIGQEINNLIVVDAIAELKPRRNHPLCEGEVHLSPHHPRPRIFGRLPPRLLRALLGRRDRVLFPLYHFEQLREFALVARIDLDEFTVGVVVTRLARRTPLTKWLLANEAAIGDTLVDLIANDAP